MDLEDKGIIEEDLDYLLFFNKNQNPKAGCLTCLFLLLAIVMSM